MQVLRAIVHLILGSGRLAVSWMGTTFLAVAILAAPFVSRLVVGYRTEGWRGLKGTRFRFSLHDYCVGWAISDWYGALYLPRSLSVKRRER